MDLLTLIDLHPDKAWDWYCLSYNPNVTAEFINNHSPESWNWYVVSCNPNITWKDINDFPHLLWDWNGILRNPNVTPDMIDLYKQFLQIINSCDWKSVSSNPNLTLEFINKHSDVKWDWHYYLSKNQYITLDIIIANLDKPWNWPKVSMNYNLTLDFINQHPNVNWDWNMISRNMNLDTIDANPDLKWDWYRGVSCNPNVTMEFINKHKNKDWEWNYISQYCNITLTDIVNNPDRHWNMRGILRNPHIIIDDIDDNMIKRYDVSTNNNGPIFVNRWYDFSYNPNITCDFINANINEHWNWYAISQNKFGKHPTLV